MIKTKYTRYGHWGSVITAAITTRTRIRIPTNPSVAIGNGVTKTGVRLKAHWKQIYTINLNEITQKCHYASDYLDLELMMRSKKKYIHSPTYDGKQKRKERTIELCHCDTISVSQITLCCII